MSDPGVGSIVIYRALVGPDPGSLYPFTAVVMCTHDSWTSDYGYTFGISQPPAGTIQIAALSGSGPGTSHSLVTEGTGAGEYSRISLDLDLGSVSLGSVDLSSAVATSVVVPDS